MDLQPLFPEHDVCEYSQERDEKTWRINNIPPGLLKYLQSWLNTQLISAAIHLVEINQNTSRMPDEIIAHRLGLIPVDLDPLQMRAFEGDDPTRCTDETCILFNLDVQNNTRQPIDVLSDQLEWVPLGDQAQKLKDRPPRAYPDLPILRLSPGKRVSLKAYAILGTGDQHKKWSQANSYFGTVTSSPQTNLLCTSCSQMGVTTSVDPGFGCYYFTIELIGGLTFQDLQKQLMLRFNWEGRYPPVPARYFFER